MTTTAALPLCHDNRSARLSRNYHAQVEQPPTTRRGHHRQHTTLPEQTRRLLSSKLQGMNEIAQVLARQDPQDVFLKIYDITEGLAHKYMSILAGFHVDGIWHTSILSHGKERFYCDGPLSMTSEAVERKFSLRLIDIVYLGHTQLDLADVDRLMEKLKRRFAPEHYDLINLNCNHFTEKLLAKMASRETRLYGYCGLVSRLPAYITEQPKLFMASARGRSLVWLVENVLEQTDNFLNTKFAQGLNNIVKRFI